MTENKNLDTFNEETDDISKLPSSFVYNLTRSVNYNGTEFKSLDLDFSKLTGKDAREIKNELTSLNINVIIPTFSDEYLIRVICKASKEKIGADFLDLASMYDYNKLIARAKAFLLKAEL